MKAYNKNDPQTIRSMFNSIAKNYDRTNAILSLQMHKRWNNALINKVLKPSKPKILLDVCSGTGAISLKYLESEQEMTKAYLLDFSETMLECAKDRADSKNITHHEIHYLHADAQNIPLEDKAVDAVTIAYGIRNVKDFSLCIKEMYRVLKPGGSLGILELTEPNGYFLQKGHKLYLKKILPIVGKFVTSNREAYEYLCQSIHSFIPRETLVESMNSCGFKNVNAKLFLGGVATLFTGTKDHLSFS